jgi:alpha-tubulin suppressor-like RCC1 family protein
MSNRWKAGFVQYFFDPLTQGPALDFGAIYSFGAGDQGVLGHNARDDISSPTQIGSSLWTEHAVGHQNSIAVTSSNELFTWGSGANGRLGHGDLFTRSSPTQVGSLTNWSKVAANLESCYAIKTDGTLWSWGGNSAGSLGQNDRTQRNSPVQIGSDTNWSSLSAGGYFCLAIKTDGTLWSWGQGTKGQLGYGDSGGGAITAFYRSSPAQVGALTTWFLAAAQTNYHSLATTTDNKLYAWGRNNYGQIGDNSRVDRSSPVQIGSLTNWKTPGGAKGGISGCVKTDGTLFTWGFGNRGATGHNDRNNRSSPTQVGTLNTWLTIPRGSGGYYFMGAIKTDGTLWSWGEGSTGQLGLNEKVDRSSPVQVGSETNWLRISMGHNSVLVSEGEQG